MLEILEYGFMQRAFIIGIIVAIICPMIGIFLVLRRMSMIGDSLAHVALAGVAASFLTGTSPLLGSLFFSVGAALGIEKLRKSYREYSEVAIAIIMSGGIGLAVILISLAKNINIDLMGYLFGSLTTITGQDLYLMFALGIFIFGIILYLYRPLFYISFDEEGARIAGISVEKINTFYIILVAIAITISMRIVGILLVSSLMVIPVAAAIQMEKSFKKTVYYSIAFSLISVLVGITLSYYYDLAPGGVIVLLCVGILLLVLLKKSMRRRVQIKEYNKNELKER
ncbi:metal ABC transporter permease [Garciella nitratireducens]|uniref:Zinc transport system permease protein n=1 Tax=Garciella nitratireducens DSM 15102 TaxID=1121911 RepID=A0A1T4NWU7_9FIRM|nr:metal ABC transporter permease [Garciella nitratireducens]SJZ83537.1 zinc transport system permease protein [Garciella nitratireducens DSM 15102]